MTPRHRLFAVLSLAAAAAVALGFFAGAYLRPHPQAALSTGMLLPERQPLASFNLVDHGNRAFTRASFEGHWSLVFIGFTHCPDICPTTLTLLREVDRQLDKRHGQLQTVFVSVDPARDTPAVLGQYVRYFNPLFVGVTGGKAEIDKLCASLKLGYVKNPGTSDAYTMDHSVALVLVDPQARVAAYFRPPFDAGRLAADLGAVVSNDGSKL